MPMPLLHTAAADPPAHLDALVSVESGVQWHVLHTRSRQEKAVALALRAAGIEHYLPLIKRSSFRGRRKCIVEQPLFASYLFLHGPKDATYFATSTKRVANIIPIPDQTRFERELAQIRAVLSAGGALERAHAITIGRRVRITAGPFRDVEGIVEDRTRHHRLILQISALGRAASLEIEEDLLELIEP